MPDNRQLMMLTDLAHDRRDKAARKLGGSMALLKESESRLVLLEGFCGDYRRRLAQSAAGGVSADELRNFREFIAKLEKAVEQQRAEADSIRQAVARCRDDWLREHRRERSFDALVERAEDAARVSEARRLQKLVDEFAGRVAMLRAAG